MVCEGLLNYFGTSSEEIAAKAKEQSDKFYLPQIEKLTDRVNSLTSENNLLVSELNKAKQILKQNNIAY